MSLKTYIYICYYPVCRNQTFACKLFGQWAYNLTFHSEWMGAKGVFYCRVPKECFIVACQKKFPAQGAKSSGGNKNPGEKSSDAKNVVAIVRCLVYHVLLAANSKRKYLVGSFRIAAWFANRSQRPIHVYSSSVKFFKLL